MTLLADAVARAGRKPLRVNNVLPAGLLQVRGRIAVAAVAGDGFDGESRRVIAIQGVLYRPWMTCMAFDALGGHRPGKLWLGIGFIARGHVPCSAFHVIRNRRLEQIIADADKISIRMATGTDDVVGLISRREPIAPHGYLDSIPCRLHREFRAGKSVGEAARRLVSRAR